MTCENCKDKPLIKGIKIKKYYKCNKDSMIMYGNYSICVKCSNKYKICERCGVKIK